MSEVVLQAVDAGDVDTVLTFDRWGVSGHKNHSSIHSAMTLLTLERRSGPSFPALLPLTKNV